MKLLLIFHVLFFVHMSVADDEVRIDYLDIAQGVIPVVIDGQANELKTGIEHALYIIDGNQKGVNITPKPGGAETQIVFTYELPATTTFDEFAIPNVLETPSPSQTFFKQVTISGSIESDTGPFMPLASTLLTTHEKAGELTVLQVTADQPVRWIKFELEGGIDIQREKTFFEFSEIIGYGSQEEVPLSDAFTGKWKGRGVKLELKQENTNVSGCYDSDGLLEGTVAGNILRATGKSQSSGVVSTFIFVADSENDITGVRSANGAPFKLYAGLPDPGLKTPCSETEVNKPGCGAVIHGINFDFDSAVIKADSAPLLNALATGLSAETVTHISVIGHTSSEGADAYNQKLSEQRAVAVVEALASRGIVAEKLSAVGQGEDQPIARNDTEAGRSLNRRVEIACQP